MRFALVLLLGCTHPAPARPIPHPLTTPHPRTDANRITREDFVACRIDTECLRRRR